MEIISAISQEKARTDPAYYNAVLRRFDSFYLTGPGLHYPTAEKLDAYDRGVDWLLSEGKRVIGHCLFPPSAAFNSAPELKGVLTSSHSQEQREEAVYIYLESILGRFGDRISDWYLLNECVSKSSGLVHKVFGDQYWQKPLSMCRKIQPDGKFRVNEYGFQSKRIVEKLAAEAKCNPSKDGVGIQVYTSGKNLMIEKTLSRRVETIRAAIGAETPLFFSEVSVISTNPFLIAKAYRAIKRVAEKYNIAELGFWWPSDKYNKSCWAENHSGLWDVDMKPSKYQSIFFNDDHVPDSTKTP